MAVNHLNNTQMCTMYTTYTYVCVHRQTHIQADRHTGRMDTHTHTQKGRKDKQTHLFSHLCATPTHDICSRASLSGAMPEAPTGMAGLDLGVIWALTPACTPQVFGTSPEEHAEAIESVKKAKVRLPPACAELTSHMPMFKDLGGGHRAGLNP